MLLSALTGQLTTLIELMFPSCSLDMYVCVCAHISCRERFLSPDWPTLDHFLIHLKERHRQIHDKTMMPLDSKFTYNVVKL